MEGKRKHERLKDENEIVVTVVDDEKEPIKEKSFNSHSMDISMSGAKIKSNISLPVDSLITIKMKLKNLGENITAIGKVKWTKGISKDKSYEAGVEFVDMPLGLEEYIVSLGRGLFTAILSVACGMAFGINAPDVIKRFDRGGKELNEHKRREALEEGRKAAETIYKQKYEEGIAELSKRFRSYQNFENKLIGMYAVGLAIANADGHISPKAKNELDAFVSGCLASNLPSSIKEQISKLAIAPPTIDQALQYAKQYEVPKRDIDEIIRLIADADGTINEKEAAFIRRWEFRSSTY